MGIRWEGKEGREGEKRGRERGLILGKYTLYENHARPIPIAVTAVLVLLCTGIPVPLISGST
jgi:hypothetical protein